MRISTNLFNNSNVSSILKKQTELHKTSQQLSSGKKILTPSDDPVGSGLAFNAKNMLANIEQYGKNIKYAEKGLKTAESTLNEIHNQLQRVRQLTVQANSDAMGHVDRQAIGKEMRSILDNVAGLMNQKDEVGNYIFAGSKVTTQPFALQPDGSYRYQGDDNERELNISASARIAYNLSGQRVFGDIESSKGIKSYAFNGNSSGNTIGVVAGDYPFLSNAQIGDYVIEKTAGGIDITGPRGQVIATGAADLSDLENYLNGASGTLDLDDAVVTGAANGDKFIIQANNEKEDLLTGLQRIADTLENFSGESYQKAFLAEAVDKVDRWMLSVEGSRTEVGVRRNGLEAIEDSNTAMELFLKEHVSELEDIDYAEAAGRFKLEQTALEASQRAFSMISNMSLFNFIR